MARSAGAGRYDRAGLSSARRSRARPVKEAPKDAARPRRARPGHEKTSAVPAEAASGVLLALFFLSLLIPARLHVGSLQLSPDRVLLLVMFVPLTLRLLSGKLGRIQPIDVFIGLYCIWIAVSMIAVHGNERIEFIGITIIELFGGYLMGRALIRSEIDYRMFFRYFFWALVLISPLVLFEQATRRIILSEILDKFVDTYPYVNQELRWGLNRVQAVFEHPIGYGLFCSMTVANFYYLNQDRPGRALSLTGFATFMTFMSLSAAPLLSIILQFGLIVWDKITNAKWALLAAIFVTGYIALDLVSNRTPPEILATTLTFNPAAAYNRVRIWTYGWQNIAAHPLFGLGLNDWVRPWFMTDSVDNFWLLNAMRHGLPAMIFLVTGIVSGLWRVCARAGLSDGEAQCRTGYMVALTGLFMTLLTVHVWGSMAILVMFFLGAGVWMTEAGSGEPALAGRRDRGGARDRNPRPARRGEATEETEETMDKTMEAAPPEPPPTPRRPPPAGRGGGTRRIQ